MKNRKFEKRTSELTSVGDAINKLLQTYHIEGKFDEAKLINAWEDVMGKTIANRTEKIYINKDVLFVRVTSAALKHELNMSKQKILTNFTEHLGKSIVKEIIII